MTDLDTLAASPAFTPWWAQTPVSRGPYRVVWFYQGRKLQTTVSGISAAIALNASLRKRGIRRVNYRPV